jgi:hypothetical protein
MKNDFIVGVEKLVNPIDVGTLHFIQNITGALPKSIQRKMVNSSAKTTPYMGFVVEPYSYFLSYEIKDLKWAQELLPDGFKMAKTSVFEGDTPKYYGIFGIFNAHTTGFWGLRVEFYMIAEDTRTGLLSWVIIDYDTNTISYDPKKGLSKPNAEGGIFTIDYDGIIHVDVKRNSGQHKLIFQSNIKNGLLKPLDKRLWIEGNLSIGYGRSLSINDSSVFSLKFDPKEFEQAIEIEDKDVNIEVNTWFPGLFEEQPSVVLCFPYAQHFLSDSPGAYSQLQNEDELLEEVNGIDFSKINIFSTKKFSKLAIMGSAASALVNLVLLALLII